MDFVDSIIRKALKVLEVGAEKITNIFINEEIANAAMVVAAWVTAADGVIKDSEVAETEKFILESELFHNLNKPALSAEYQKWCKWFKNSPQDAVLDALVEVSPLADKPEAESVLKLAVRIAKSDNECSRKEKEVIVKLCHILRVKLDKECSCGIVRKNVL